MRTVLAALVVLVAAVPALSQEVQPPRITVTGEGRVEAVPDMATVSLGVLREAETADAAMAALAEATGSVIAALEAAGIDGRDVQTDALRLSPVRARLREDEEGPPPIVGFAAETGLTVRVRDLGALGDVLDAVVQEGGNLFSGLRFGLQEPGPLEDEARRRAVADARAKAELYAEAAGVTLGPLHALTEAGPVSPLPVARMESAMMADAGAMPVAEGEIALTARVMMVYAIAE